MVFKTKIESIEQIEKAYSANWRESDKRTVGPEEEYPLINLKTLESAKHSDLEKLFVELNNSGWKKYYDDQTKKLVGVKKKVSGYESIISTDFGTGTVEINFPFGTNLNEIKLEYDVILNQAALAAKSCGLAMLGYAIQPLSKPSSSLVAQKGRYNSLNARFWTTHRLKPTREDPCLTDVHYHTINSANQVHVSVKNEDEAIKGVNLLNAAVPILIGMNANSPVWMGKPDKKYMEPRELFWDWVVDIPRDNQNIRKGIPRKFTSLGDYVSEIVKFEPVLSARQVNGEVRYIELFGCNSFSDFMDKGYSKVFLPGTVDRAVYDNTGNISKSIKGAKKIIENGCSLDIIEPTLIDLYAHDSFVWYDARLKAEYGTIELRCAGQQPPGEEFVIPGITLGLMEKLDDLEQLLGNYSTDETRIARLDAAKKGFNAKYAGDSIQALAHELYCIAHEGLKYRKQNEEHVLEPLEERIHTGINSASKALDDYYKGGLRYMVEKKIIHGN